MNTDHANAELFSAISQAQGEIENAAKNSANPHFRSKYADLAEILNTVRPVFSKFGLSLIQSTEFNGSLVSVTTLIAHKSGGYVTAIASCVPAKTDAQGVGSATTYLRRYAAAAVSGIAQEDDDGNAAAHNSKPVPVAQKQGQPTSGAWDNFTEERAEQLRGFGATANEYWGSEDVSGGADFLERQGMNSDEKIAVWTLLPSAFRTALKKHHTEKQKEAA